MTATTCKRHPRTETRLSCVNCEDAICPKCMVTGPVGNKCPDCGSRSKTERGELTGADLRRLVVMLGLGTFLFALAQYGLLEARIPFLSLVLTYVFGVVYGRRAVSFAKGRRTVGLGRTAAALAAVASIWAFVLFAGTFAILFALEWTVRIILTAAVAAFGAWSGVTRV